MLRPVLNSYVFSYLQPSRHVAPATQTYMGKYLLLAFSCVKFQNFPLCIFCMLRNSYALKKQCLYDHHDNERYTVQKHPGVDEHCFRTFSLAQTDLSGIHPEF